ncbi:cell cycle checkpoint protein RAD17 [Pelomyxa schiedti]|nr:cell cycle checkpoint protein RAD17 [Pelomyxa schiedti]
MKKHNATRPRLRVLSPPPTYGSDDGDDECEIVGGGGEGKPSTSSQGRPQAPAPKRRRSDAHNDAPKPAAVGTQQVDLFSFGVVSTSTSTRTTASTRTKPTQPAAATKKPGVVCTSLWPDGDESPSDVDEFIRRVVREDKMEGGGGGTKSGKKTAASATTASRKSKPRAPSAAAAPKTRTKTGSGDTAKKKRAAGNKTAQEKKARYGKLCIFNDGTEATHGGVDKLSSQKSHNASSSQEGAENPIVISDESSQDDPDNFNSPLNSKTAPWSSSKNSSKDGPHARPLSQPTPPNLDYIDCLDKPLPTTQPRKPIRNNTSLPHSNTVPDESRLPTTTTQIYGHHQAGESTSLVSSSKEKQDQHLGEKVRLPTSGVQLWLDTHIPKTEAALVVAKPKLNELKTWLVASQNQPKHVLILDGPSGCGKTAAVKVLASSLGLTLCEWVNVPDSHTLTLEGKFENYLPQIERFKSWVKSSRAMDLVTRSAHKVMLIEDVPNIHGPKQEAQLKEILEWFISFARFPLICILSDLYSRDIPAFTRVVVRNFKTDDNFKWLHFNAVTRPPLERLLKTIAQEEGFSTIPSKILGEFVEKSGGDIRAAINSLQFYCNGISFPKAAVSPLSIGSRDLLLNMLHAVGKIVYNKRLETPVESSHPNFRAPMKSIPEDIISQIHMNPSRFTSFVHQNYINIFSDIEEIAESLEFLSQADTVDSRTIDFPPLEEYASSVTLRGFLFSHVNANAKMNGREVFHRPLLFEVERNAQRLGSSIKSLPFKYSEYNFPRHSAEDVSVPHWMASPPTMLLEVLPWAHKLYQRDPSFQMFSTNTHTHLMKELCTFDDFPGLPIYDADSTLDDS